MNRVLQKVLLAAYAGVRRTGVLETRAGRAVFLAAYRSYKHRFEAGPVNALRAHVRPGAWIIDVGANVGVFTELFCGWVSGTGRVLAVEPEARNLEDLRAAAAKAGRADMVDIVEGAAAAQTGRGFLAVNKDHPGDHRLTENSTGAAPVALHALDDILAARGGPPVCLIKIDVQGAEKEVIAGAEKTLRTHQPAVFMEIDDAALRAQGADVRDLLARMKALGYAPSRPAALQGGQAAPWEDSEIIAQAQNGYIDVLFLPVHANSNPGLNPGSNSGR